MITPSQFTSNPCLAVGIKTYVLDRGTKASACLSFSLFGWLITGHYLMICRLPYTMSRITK